MKRTPIDTIVRTAGATFIEEGGWQVVQADTAVSPTTLSLTDHSARGKLFVEGQAAEAVLTAVLAMPTLAINQGAVIPDGVVYRLRQDLFLLNMAVAGETAVQAKVEEAIQAQAVFVTVTDGTHGRFQFQLRGERSPDLLSRVCGLDFHDSQFPNFTAKQSSVAKTAQIIMRQDADGTCAYFLLGARSLAVYVWQTLRQAGQDLGLTAW
jgi:heterotetrameric sarcosine oxidase gamma subunit